MSSKAPRLGVGLGLRREHFGSLLDRLPPEIEWFEIAPENYIEIGGKIHRDFIRLSQKLPIVSHSVSLSLGSLDPLDRDFLKKIKKFIRTYDIPMASDHVCFSSFKNVQFDDLLPLPFTAETIRHISKKIRQTMDILEVPFAVENISYYAPNGAPEMKEEEFISAIVEESGALLLLDVNNIYVNSVNHGFDPSAYLKAMPLDRIAYVHIAGHKKKRPDFLLDTHGDDIIDPVWRLLDELAAMTPLPAVMIERDGNIPEIEHLVEELKTVRRILDKHSPQKEPLRVAL